VFENTHDTTLEVYLVDNASADGTAAAVQAEFPSVHVIHNETRLGFSTNNNLVLRRGQGRYLMLLNDDTLVLDGALDRLVEFMDAHPEAGAVGSFLLNEDGSVQPAFAPFPHPLWEGLLPATHAAFPRAKRAGKEPIDVDSVCGAAMLVRRQVVDQVGVLDTAFDPIYSEEVDWCYRIKQASWRIYALPRSRIIHYGGQTMNRMMPRKYELLLSHKMLFFSRHTGKRAANLYRTVLTLSTVAKLAWWTIAGKLARDRQRAEAKMQLHRHILHRIPYFLQ
jgi:GT2 family glycosyltransferase